MTQTQRDEVDRLAEQGRDHEAAVLALRHQAAKETPMTTTATPSIDFEAIKSRQRDTWSSGDYAVIGTTLQIVGETLCEAVEVEADDEVLDVAAGNGNASLAAARRGARVTASDYVPALLEGTIRRAASEGLTIKIEEADAEALPFADASFDVVLSTFGVMFCPDQEQAASELLRVCRRGGRIGLANWASTGFVGRMLKIVSSHMPPSPGVRSPLEWGTEGRLAELFGRGVRKLEAPHRDFVFRYRSAENWLETFRTYYGPTFKAFGVLDDAERGTLEAELLALANEFNTSTTGKLRIPGEYLQVVAVRT